MDNKPIRKRKHKNRRRNSKSSLARVLEVDIIFHTMCEYLGYNDLKSLRMLSKQYLSIITRFTLMNVEREAIMPSVMRYIPGFNDVSISSHGLFMLSHTSLIITGELHVAGSAYWPDNFQSGTLYPQVYTTVGDKTPGYFAMARFKVELNNVGYTKTLGYIDTPVRYDIDDIDPQHRMAPSFYITSQLTQLGILLCHTLGESTYFNLAIHLRGDLPIPLNCRAVKRRFSDSRKTDGLHWHKEAFKMMAPDVITSHSHNHIYDSWNGFSGRGSTVLKDVVHDGEYYANYKHPNSPSLYNTTCGVYISIPVIYDNTSPFINCCYQYLPSSWVQPLNGVDYSDDNMRINRQSNISDSTYLVSSHVNIRYGVPLPNMHFSMHSRLDSSRRATSLIKRKIWYPKESGLRIYIDHRDIDDSTRKWMEIITENANIYENNQVPEDWAGRHFTRMPNDIRLLMPDDNNRLSSTSLLMYVETPRIGRDDQDTLRGSYYWDGNSHLYDFTTYTGQKSLTGCINLRKYINAAYWRAISTRRFDGCYSLQNVEVPNRTSWICRSAFQRSGLTTIDLSKATKLSEISESTFAYSTIETIAIPPNVRRIENSAFQSCHLLEQVIIPKGSKLKHIGYRAFHACRKLHVFSFKNAHIEQIHDFAFFRTGLVGHVTISEFDAHNPVTHLGSCIFGDTRISSILVHCKSIEEVLYNKVFSCMKNLIHVNCTFIYPIRKDSRAHYGGVELHKVSCSNFEVLRGRDLDNDISLNCYGPMLCKAVGKKYSSKVLSSPLQYISHMQKRTKESMRTRRPHLRKVESKAPTPILHNMSVVSVSLEEVSDLLELKPGMIVSSLHKNALPPPETIMHLNMDLFGQDHD